MTQIMTLQEETTERGYKFNFVKVRGKYSEGTTTSFNSILQSLEIDGVISAKKAMEIELTNNDNEKLSMLMPFVNEIQKRFTLC